MPKFDYRKGNIYATIPWNVIHEDPADNLYYKAENVKKLFGGQKAVETKYKEYVEGAYQKQNKTEAPSAALGDDCLNKNNECQDDTEQGIKGPYKIKSTRFNHHAHYGFERIIIKTPVKKLVMIKCHNHQIEQKRNYKQW